MVVPLQNTAARFPARSIPAMPTNALFEGIVCDEQERPLPVDWVGADACYVFDDAGFARYVDAGYVDRQVLAYFKEQVDEHRDVAVRGMLQMLGKDDIFSKTAIEYQIDRMDEVLGQSLPPQARDMLRAMGFRIVIDSRGDVVEINMPERLPPGWPPG